MLYGYIHFENEDFINAKQCYEDAINLYQIDGNHPFEGWALVWLGRILGKMDLMQKDKAEDHILRGVEILKNYQFKPLYSLGYLFLGELYKNRDHKEKAFEYLKMAEDNFHGMEIDFWLSITRNYLQK